MDPSTPIKINLQPHLQELHDLLYLLYLDLSETEIDFAKVDYHQKVLQQIIPQLPKYYLIDPNAVFKE